jgi:hypothetical protein
MLTGFLRNLGHLLGPQVGEPVDQADKARPADDVADGHRQQVLEKKLPQVRLA